MMDSFFIDTGHGADDSPDKKQKKSKSKHKKERTLEKETEMSNGTDGSMFVYISNDKILGNETSESGGAAEIDEGDRPKGRRPMFRRSTNKRYHETGDGGDAKPGVLSDALRQAMGMHRNQLPFYIYRMRELGYPPGWLKDAEKTGSSVVIISDEVDDEKPVEYDVQKLVAYPGFNVVPPKGVYDDWRKFRALPMQEHQQLEVMRRQLSNGAYDSFMDEPSTSARAGSGEAVGGAATKRHLHSSSGKDDMDVEDETGENCTKMSRFDSTDAGSSSRNSVTSETELKQLEEERRRIIDQLNSTQAEGDAENALEDPCVTDDEEAVDPGSEQEPLNHSQLGSPVYMLDNAVRKVEDLEKFSQGIEEFRPYVCGEVSGTFQKVMGALKEAKKSRKSFMG